MTVMSMGAMPVVSVVSMKRPPFLLGVRLCLKLNDTTRGFLFPRREQPPKDGWS